MRCPYCNAHMVMGNVDCPSCGNFVVEGLGVPDPFDSVKIPESLTPNGGLNLFGGLISGAIGVTESLTNAFQNNWSTSSDPYQDDWANPANPLNDGWSNPANPINDDWANPANTFQDTWSNPSNSFNDTWSNPSGFNNDDFQFNAIQDFFYDDGWGF